MNLRQTLRMYDRRSSDHVLLHVLRGEVLNLRKESGSVSQELFFSFVQDFLLRGRQAKSGELLYERVSAQSIRQ